MRLGRRPGSSIYRPSILIILRLELDLIVGGRRAEVRLRGSYGHGGFRNARLVGGVHSCTAGRCALVVTAPDVALVTSLRAGCLWR